LAKWLPFDGFVANYMGDGVLVYFGYPQGHEDDAERAVGSLKQTALSARRACARSVVRSPIHSSINSAWRASVRTSLWSHRRHLTEGLPPPGTMQSNM
jgi:class 3 adenylate cyclase